MTITTATMLQAIPSTPPEEVPWTIDELIRRRAADMSDTPLVAYPIQGIDYKAYTARELDSYAYAIAQSYTKTISRRKCSSENVKVVGMLAPSNLDYLLSTLALTKMGMTVLFLSPRLTTEGYLNLVRLTGCQDLIIDATTAPIGETLKTEMPTLQVHQMAVASSFDFALKAVPQDTAMDTGYNLAIENLNHCWIIHSSGSTGLPKPIYQTHAAAIRNYANNFGMRGFITLPLFHAHGISSVFRGISSGKLIYMYNAKLPLTATTLIETMRRYTFEIFYGVPYALKLLGESDQGLKLLSALKLVMFGGSSCPKELGDRLVRNGVMLVSHYGTTETGQLMTSFRERDDLDWDFLRVSKSLQPFVRWEEQGPGLFELVVLDGWPSKVATNRPDGAYATKDLFVRHPDRSECFQWSGRLDDTLVLLNGEKANPIPIEHMLRQCPSVAEAVVFGGNKTQLGAMIIPKPSAGPCDESKLRAELESWLIAANASVPAYSQVSMDMIKILPADLKYSRTDKDTVIRPAFYRQFQNEIDAVYDDAQRVVSNTGSAMDAESLFPILRDLLQKTLQSVDPAAITDTADFFSLGLDSLQALRIRSKLIKLINTQGRSIGQNVVFEHPTIQALCDHLLALQNGTDVKVMSPEEQMQGLLDKFSNFTPHVPGTADEPAAVVLTGATGSLGAHMLAQLVASPSVDKVYALVRAKDTEQAQARVVASLKERRVHDSLTSDMLGKVVALSSDLSREDLGVDQAENEAMRRRVTTIIHLAWPVNFNMGIDSFEPHLQGVHNLLSLALQSRRPQPASFHFGSSVSSVAGSTQAVAEIVETNFTCAQKMGYARSKLVAENICARAARSTSMTARTYRIGQIIGDTRCGIWNETEAIPLLIRSALATGCLPALDETPTWLPVDTVAKSMLELIAQGDECLANDAVIHVVNPTSFHWTRKLLPALQAAGLTFEKVDKKTWVERLRQSDLDATRNPSIKLLDFFAAKYDNDSRKPHLYYKTDLACSMSPTLHSASNLDESHVARIVEHWRATAWAQVASSEVVS